MKKSSATIVLTLVLIILSLSSIFTSCKKPENPIKFPKGTFPDTATVALSHINSAYDDYNMDIHQFLGYNVLIFSSNRSSTGGQFDLMQGMLTYNFDQTYGDFVLGGEMTSDPFLTKLLTAANTTGDDFGPYTLFSPVDGYEYLLLSSENAGGNLDFYYLKHRPVLGSALPDVFGPYPASLLNTGSDDAYICFDLNQDSIYFSSDNGGNFDIYFKKRPSEIPIDSWLNSSYSASAKVDSINTTGDERFPFVYKKLMVFASNCPGGLGGYDLYYSVFRKGKWSSPVNFGPGINTSSNEYRPVIGHDDNFTNNFLIFSSDRPGGKGGFDLYFRGITIKY
jgi:hypothetical protein